jgi:hypothetical protein
MFDSVKPPPHPNLDPSVTGLGPHQTLLIRRPFQDPMQHVPEMNSIEYGVMLDLNLEGYPFF